MYLRRIEAVRYGELAGQVLADLGPGLNVALGPNEAGKSTLTSLVRHILYGFPRGRTLERQYLPSSGDQRVGRLVFVDGGDRLTIERVEGVHGGPAVLHGPQGEEPADALLETLTRGVSAGAFAAVFGFSLEQLSDLRSLDDIGSRLYATAAGLRANPNDVLDDVRAEADRLWAPRARTRVLHELNAEVREIRERRRRANETAERYRADREQRSAVAAELETLERTAAAVRLGADRLAALLGEARRLAERARESAEAEVEHRLAAEVLRRDAAAAEVDEGLLGRAESVERLGARCELFRSEVEQLRRDEERVRKLDLDLERRVGDLGEGWTLEDALALRLDLDLENRLYELEERLREARRQRDESQRRASEAEAESSHAEAAALARSQELGVAGSELAADEVGIRLQTVDRLIALGGELADRPALGIPAAASAIIAVVLAAAGWYVGDRWLLTAALLPAALAAGLLLWHVVGRRRTPPGLGSLLQRLGLERVPPPAELLEIKHGLEDCRRLWAAAEQHARSAEARGRSAEEAAAAWDTAWEAWSGWLREQRLLTPSNQPDSVRRVLTQLREVRDAAEARRELAAQAARRRETAEVFVAEAREIGAVAAAANGADLFDEVWHDVRSLQAKLAAAREQLAQRRGFEGEARAAEERAEAAAEQGAGAAAVLGDILGQAGLDATATVADLEAATAAAGRKARELEASREELLEARGTLDGRLQRVADESGSAELRLAEAGVTERVREALESYAVAAVATRLLETSLATYEAERQPLVIQRAQELFVRLTGRRYSRLATPLGRFEPAVSAADGAGKTPDRLSRATAEQLFLALRLSYIERLAGAHPALPVLMDDVLVNFDDERRAAAVEVIAEFAERRQVIFFTCHQATVDAFEASTERPIVRTLER